MNGGGVCGTIYGVVPLVFSLASCMHGVFPTVRLSHAAQTRAARACSRALTPAAFMQHAVPSAPETSLSALCNTPFYCARRASLLSTFPFRPPHPPAPATSTSPPPFTVVTGGARAFSLYVWFWFCEHVTRGRGRVMDVHHGFLLSLSRFIFSFWRFKHDIAHGTPSRRAGSVVIISKRAMASAPLPPVFGHTRTGWRGSFSERLNRKQ